MLGLLTLSACQSSHVALVHTVKASANPQSTQPFNMVPGLRYLKVETPGALTYMVLGDIEPGDPYDVEVWYGASRQVLKLRNGRVVKTAGLPVNWTSSALEGEPSWIQASGQPAQFVRVRDVMPGYRYSVQETVVLRRTEPPKGEATRAVAPESERMRWVWFSEETIQTTPLAAPVYRTALPRSVFAVDLQSPKQPLRWSEQCLSPTFCLRMEPLEAASKSP
jgi:hypothetical protein